MPLVAVMKEIKKLEPHAEFWFLGPKSDFNVELAAARVRMEAVRAGKLRRYFDWKNLVDVLNLLCGVGQALKIVHREKPAVVFSKGGFAGVPTVVAGKILRAAIVLHESDTVAGLANRLTAKLADKICLSFEDVKQVFPKNKVIVTGNPMRSELREGDRARGLNFLGFNQDKLVLLVFGGSQGAQKLNRLTGETLPHLLKKFQVVHIVGKNNVDETEQILTERRVWNRCDRKDYRLLPFVGKEMKDVYAAADLVVSRAGANSLAEILALEKPALVVPLASAAGNHQFHNAAHFAERGLVLMVEEKTLDGQSFAEKIEELEKRSAVLRKNLAKYNAALDAEASEVKIAKEVLKAGRKV